ncbi:MAG TPA: thiamine-phosphate kinase [Gemmatimonadaceae bacterium]|jgi:thiamine-monophosphate kinase
MTQHHSTPQRHTALGRGGEFDMIRHLVQRWGRAARGLGDDAAILDTPAGEQLVVSTDTSVEGVHFRRRWLTSGEIGYRSAMAALSDLAAMGARPLGMLVALALPPEWTQDFGLLADGIGEAARDVACPIIGGDLSRAEMLHCTFTVLGSSAHPVLRSGAKAGDSVYVTGHLGGPGAALRALSAGEDPAPLERHRFARPVARVREGTWIAEHGANAMIDLSDGLVSDAEHMATASGVRLTIDLDRLPVLAGCAARDAARSGEEYELLFTAAGLDANEFVRTFGLQLTAIGHVGALVGEDRVMFMSHGKRVDLEKGYDHFSR